MWIECGFRKYFDRGWQMEFDYEFKILYSDEHFPILLCQLVSRIKEYYLKKGEKFGVYNTKDEFKKWLGVK